MKPTDLTAAEKRMINLAFVHWKEHGEWPKRAQVMGQLSKDGVNPETTFARRLWDYAKSEYGGVVELTLYGLAAADGSEDLIAPFMPLVRRGIEAYIAKPRAAPKITDADLRDVAGSLPLETLRSLGPIYQNELGSIGSGSGRLGDGTWNVPLSPKCLRYRPAKDIWDFKDLQEKRSQFGIELGPDHEKMLLWIFNEWCKGSGDGPDSIAITHSLREVLPDPATTFEEIPEDLVSREIAYPDRPTRVSFGALLKLRPRSDDEIGAIVSLIRAVCFLYSGGEDSLSLSEVVAGTSLSQPQVERSLAMASSMPLGFWRADNTKDRVRVTESIFGLTNLNSMEDLLRYLSEKDREREEKRRSFEEQPRGMFGSHATNLLLKNDIDAAPSMAGAVSDGAWSRAWSIERTLRSDTGQGDTFIVLKGDGDDRARYVLKVLKHRGPEGFEKARSRFLNEMGLLKQFSGKTGFLTLLDHNLDSALAGTEAPFFVTNLVQHGTLQELLASGNPFCGNLDKATKVILRLCETVGRLHEAGHIHRDIKPDNVVFDDPGHESPVLIDFGLIRDVGSAREVSSSSESIGPWEYRPPEFEPHGPDMASPRSDIYLVARLLHTMLSRECCKGHGLGEQKEPFHRRVPYDLEVQFKDDVRFRALNDLLDISLAWDHSQRQSSIAVFAEQLERVQRGTAMTRLDQALSDKLRKATSGLEAAAQDERVQRERAERIVAWSRRVCEDASILGFVDAVREKIGSAVRVRTQSSEGIVAELLHPSLQGTRECPSHTMLHINLKPVPQFVLTPEPRRVEFYTSLIYAIHVAGNEATLVRWTASRKTIAGGHSHSSLVRFDEAFTIGDPTISGVISRDLESAFALAVDEFTANEDEILKGE